MRKKSCTILFAERELSKHNRTLLNRRRNPTEIQLLLSDLAIGPSVNVSYLMQEIISNAMRTFTQNRNKKSPRKEIDFYDMYKIYKNLFTLIETGFKRNFQYVYEFI